MASRAHACHCQGNDGNQAQLALSSPGWFGVCAPAPRACVCVRARAGVMSQHRSIRPGLPCIVQASTGASGQAYLALCSPAQVHQARPAYHCEACRTLCRPAAAPAFSRSPSWLAAGPR
eukprot:866044-Pelagomonas_calceolata.AAC.7